MTSSTTLSPRKCLTCCPWFQTLSIPSSILFLVLCSPAFQCCPRSVDGATPFLTSSRFHGLCETVFPLPFPSCVLFSFSKHCLLSLSLCPHQPQLKVSFVVPLLIVLPFPNVFYPQHTAGKRPGESSLPCIGGVDPFQDSRMTLQSTMSAYTEGIILLIVELCKEGVGSA